MWNLRMNPGASDPSWPRAGETSTTASPSPSLRIVPVAPFAVINLVAGASHIRLRDFALGTLVGLLPGITVIALFADGLVNSIRDPDTNSFAWLVGAVLVIIVTMPWLLKWLNRRQVPLESREGP